MKLSRVILSTDANPDYLGFWPVAAKAWKRLIGITPTLAFIAYDDVPIDETLGDVIRFEPIEGVPHGFQAQVIRLLLPALFENDICIISDIDQIPISKKYFCGSIKDINEDCFVIYKECFSRFAPDEFPMCYVAAKGKIFQDIFSIKTRDEIRQKIKTWWDEEYPKYGWSTDQKLLYQHVIKWRFWPVKAIRLGEDWVHKKLHSYDWPSHKSLFRSGYFNDAGLLKPYHMHEYNKELARELGLDP